MEALTPSLEDYLEAIWTISLKNKVARVKDIAKYLAVTKPSVVNALSALKGRNMIKQESYGYVELTEEGAIKAKEVNQLHKLLFTLLHEILALEPEVASKDACIMEHHLSKETITKIQQFIEFLEKNQEAKAFFASKFGDFIKKGKDKKEKEMETYLTPKDLKPGERAKVIKIKGDLKKRLLDMGIVPGTEVQLKKVAPLGDPIDLLVKGYHLSLRKDEARDILLEKI